MRNNRDQVFPQRELGQQPEERTYVALAYLEHFWAARKRRTVVKLICEQNEFQQDGQYHIVAVKRQG